MKHFALGLAVPFALAWVAACATANSAPPAASLGATVRADEARICGVLRSLAAATARPLTDGERTTLAACELVLAVNAVTNPDGGPP